MSDIDWSNSTVKQYANESTKCQLLLNICNDQNLEQQVSEPTRTRDRASNILNLIVMTHPNSIKNTEVVEGISDHDAVLSDVDLLPKISKKKPRQIFIYCKGNMPGEKYNFKIFHDEFVSEHLQRSTNYENWLSSRQWGRTFLVNFKDLVPTSWDYSLHQTYD